MNRESKSNPWLVTQAFLYSIGIVWLTAESGMALRDALELEHVPLWWPFWTSFCLALLIACLAADLFRQKQEHAPPWLITRAFLHSIGGVWLAAESGMALRDAFGLEHALWWPFWTSFCSVLLTSCLVVDLLRQRRRQAGPDAQQPVGNSSRQPSHQGRTQSTPTIITHGQTEQMHHAC